MPGVLSTTTRCAKPGKLAGGLIGRLSTAAATPNRTQAFDIANNYAAFPFRSAVSIALVETVETEDGADGGCYKYADSRRVTDRYLRVGFCPGENPAALEIMGLATPLVSNDAAIPATVYPTGTTVGTVPTAAAASCAPCGSSVTNPTWTAWWICNDPDGSNATAPWYVIATPLAYWRKVDGDTETLYTSDGAPDTVEYEAVLKTNTQWKPTTAAAAAAPTGPVVPWATPATRSLFPSTLGLTAEWAQWVTDIPPPPLPAGSTCDQACGYYTFV